MFPIYILLQKWIEIQLHRFHILFFMHDLPLQSKPQFHFPNISSHECASISAFLPLPNYEEDLKHEQKPISYFSNVHFFEEVGSHVDQVLMEDARSYYRCHGNLSTTGFNIFIHGFETTMSEVIPSVKVLQDVFTVYLLLKIFKFSYFLELLSFQSHFLTQSLLYFALPICIVSFKNILLYFTFEINRAQSKFIKI